MRESNRKIMVFHESDRDSDNKAYDALILLKRPPLNYT